MGLPPDVYKARLVVTRDFGRLRLYLSDPALVHEALVRHADKLAKTYELKRVLGAALGDGLLTSDGPVWRWQRQTIAPAFQHERLLAFLPAMIAAAEARREAWRALPPGSEIDLGHEMMQTTFRIILDTMLSGPDGIDSAAVERNVTAFLGATSWMFALSVLRAPAWTPFPGRQRALKAKGMLREVIMQRVAARRHAPGGSDDLVSMLLAAADPETGRALTDTEITDNIITFIGAGHETTAIALGWTFALLSRNPICLAKVLAEIAAVTGNGPVRPEHIAALVYTKQVLNETMRLYPPAPLIAREVEQAFDLEGLRLPKGTILMVPIYAIHRHPSLWVRPESFDPDRFAPEAQRHRHRFAFMPFGAGPRVCIGNNFALMEGVTILAVLLQAIRLDTVEKELPSPQMRVTLRPSQPLLMRVSPRASQAENL
jgi:cytochrome P450